MDKRKLLKVIGIVLIGLLLFEGMLFIYGSSIATILYQALFFGKYNLNFISEIVILLFSFFILVIRKRLNILKPKGKKFIDSLKRGMPILVIALFVLISNLLTIKSEELNIPNFISLILFAITVGMAEEFFFRGFIQEEIISAYGKTRRQVIISIVISGIIFGVVHLSNALGSQGIIATIMQVLQASSLGILIGSIYYVTKNIWSVVFLHSFYDFAILLGEVNTFKDCVSGDNNLSTAMFIFTLVGTLVYSIIYLVGAYLNLQERHVNEYINEEVTEEIVKKNENGALRAKQLVVVVIVLFIWVSLFIPSDDVTNYETCFTYESIVVEGEISYSTQDHFVINDVILSIDNHNLVITSSVDENQIVKELDNAIYDIYIYELDNNYHILLNADEILYYGIVSKDIVIYSNEFGDALINSFQKYDVPSINMLGSIATNEEVYPIIRTYISDYFIIKDNKVLVIDNN